MTSTQSSAQVPSHHLIGRALVPFFDAEENVNASMTVDPMTQLYEQVDIDARVWDKTLGYFVYPNEQTNTNTTTTTTTSVSTPITIQKPVLNGQKSLHWNEKGGNTSMLLTPEFLLSRSAPPSSSSSSCFKTRVSSTQTNTIQVPLTNSTSSTEKSTTRSSSVQRSSSRSKSRSTTPNRTSSSSSSSPSIKENGKKKRNKEKVKEELSTNGKWAWSAFQNSPDPKSLPLPPSFIHTSPVGTANISSNKGKMTIPLELPPPCVPPDLNKEKEKEASIEQSMTLGLRRMLNIGGG